MLKQLLIILLLWWQLSSVAIAQPLNGTTALERLFTQPFDATWFSPTFLQNVPAAQVEAIVGQIQQELGAYQTVQQVGEGNYRLEFEQGTVQAQLELNAAGEFVGLLFRPAGLSPSEALAAVQTLSGEVNFLIQRDGQVLAAHHSDRALAVGSAFKLAVLAAVQEAVEQENLAWDQVITLNPAWKSLPSGMLQNWPDHAPLTVQTLATLMIALSDNTATDALMDLVGADALQPFASQNQPFLTTQQAFKVTYSRRSCYA